MASLTLQFPSTYNFRKLFFILQFPRTLLNPKPMTFYQPLRSTDEGMQIRLCSLLPDSFRGPVKCYIEVFDPKPGLEFEALSYSWGDPTDRIPIEAKGETVLVTKNLATALTYLRKTSDSRRLWIDAICINENDIDERSMQVAFMRKCQGFQPPNRLYATK
jgi:Heterokaryon incompatibility protein (HET)